MVSLSKEIKPEHLKQFISVSDPQLSPDLKNIAFLTVKVDEQKDDYHTTIWVVDRSNGEPLMYLDGGKDLWPRWSPNGRHLLFLSRRTLKSDEKGGELWVIPVNRGEPRLVLKMKGGISTPQWFPDGEKISFISTVEEDGSEESIKVVRRIPLWFNAAGFTYNLRQHLFMAHIDSGDVVQLTEGNINVAFATPSNSGDKIAYVASTNDLYPIITDIFVLDLKTNERIKLTESNMVIGPLCWSPDDKYIAFRGHNLRRGFATHEDIWLISADGGQPENLTRRLDRGTSLRVYYDLIGPFVFLYAPIPAWDGDNIYFPVSDRGRFNLYKLNMNNKAIEPVIVGDFIICDFSVKKNVIAYTKVTETEPAEIWVKDDIGDRKITNFNGRLLSKLDISIPQRFEFKASDGRLVEGWMLKPSNLKEGEKYPVIFDIHGGPKSAFGYAFMFEHQLFASKGFVVVYPNPRGSDGYDEEFADIRGRYGERDFQDIMECVDYVISKYEFIDQNRMGVTGISYGGFMTNWIITHTDRFKAAISQNGIADWTAFFGTTDIGFYFAPDQIGKNPWDNADAYRGKSPLTYAQNVKTPVMFIHSLEDYRCWVDQAIAFFTALKYLGKETELVLFMKGDHVFSRVGKPGHRVKRLEHMLRWFEKYLKM